MPGLVARTGRHKQRYEDGYRLVAGCIPYKYTMIDNDDDSREKVVKVLMINSNRGPGLLFPKGGWENDETVEEAALREAIEEAGVQGDLMDSLGCYIFQSKTHENVFCPKDVCKAFMYTLLVKEELPKWPEDKTRRRSWLAIAEAKECCCHGWMKDALENAIQTWNAGENTSTSQLENHATSSSSSSPFL